MGPTAKFQVHFQTLVTKVSFGSSETSSKNLKSWQWNILLSSNPLKCLKKSDVYFFTHPITKCTRVHPYQRETFAAGKGVMPAKSWQAPIGGPHHPARSHDRGRLPTSLLVRPRLLRLVTQHPRSPPPERFELRLPKGHGRGGGAGSSGLDPNVRVRGCPLGPKVNQRAFSRRGDLWEPTVQK